MSNASKVLPDVSDLMRQWNSEKNSALGLDPAKLRTGSHKKVWWKCGNGHEWAESVANMVRRHSCPYCSKRVVLTGNNDLQTTHPCLASEWDFEANAPLCPDEVTAISIKRVGWICATCGHKWITRIRDRALKGTGCNECASKRACGDRPRQTLVKHLIRGVRSHSLRQLLV